MNQVKYILIYSDPKCIFMIHINRQNILDQTGSIHNDFSIIFEPTSSKVAKEIFSGNTIKWFYRLCSGKTSLFDIKCILILF